MLNFSRPAKYGGDFEGFAPMFWATLIHFLLPVAVWAGLRWQPERIAAEGEVRRYSQLARLIAWLALILSPVIPMCFALILQGKREQDVWLIRSCFACAWLFLIAGVCAWRETRYGYLVLSAEGLRRVSPWLGTSDLPWQQVIGVKITPKGFVILSDVDGARFTLIPHLWADMDSIMEAINSRVNAGAFVGI